jgi:hypothetical protein
MSSNRPQPTLDEADAALDRAATFITQRRGASTSGGG